MPRMTPYDAHDVDLAPILDAWADAKRLLRTELIVPLRHLRPRPRIARWENQVIVDFGSVFLEGSNYPRDLAMSIAGYSTRQILCVDGTVSMVEVLPRLVVRHGDVVEGRAEERTYELPAEEGIGNRLVLDTTPLGRVLAQARKAILAFPDALASALASRRQA